MDGTCLGVCLLEHQLTFPRSPSNYASKYNTILIGWEAELEKKSI